MHVTREQNCPGKTITVHARKERLVNRDPVMSTASRGRETVNIHPKKDKAHNDASGKTTTTERTQREKKH
jgi:hypothetical protein